MAPHTYGEILARNIRAARSRIGIGQENIAVRMRALGYEAWIRQTVSSHGARTAPADSRGDLRAVLRAPDVDPGAHGPERG